MPAGSGGVGVAYDQDSAYPVFESVSDPVSGRGVVPSGFGEDDAYTVYAADLTFEPYDFLPAEPSGAPGPGPGSASSPWHDDASREARWAALREASGPSESAEDAT
jgi:hypothetical protein